MQSKKFKGPLATPIKSNWIYPSLVPIHSDEYIEQNNKNDTFNITIERLEKLPLLFERYNIKYKSSDNENPDYLLLCVAMACEFIPGFKTKDNKKIRGRKKKWTPVQYTILLGDIEFIKKERSCGDREACKIYLQRQKKLNKLPNIKVIEARLVEARQPKRNPLFGLTEKFDDEIRPEFLQILREHFT
jgi:hypothetical protein